MKFEPGNQNGITPATELKSKASRFGLIASSTSTIYGQPLYLKALSDAAMYKTEPVSFYGIKSGSTATTLIGTSTFRNTVESILATTSLATGTWLLWAQWPGEGIYAPTSTSANSFYINVTAGANLGGAITVTSTPPSGSMVVGQGTATFTATMTTSTIVPGSMYWLVNGIQIATLPVLDNKTSISISNLGTGTNTVTATWPGGNIGGTVYQGQSGSASYEILRGTTASGTLSLSVGPTNYGIFQEGNVVLTATITTSTVLPGNITFYKDNSAIYIGAISNNSLTHTFPSVDAVGTYTYHAVWNGNQTSHPRYIEKQSSSSTWRVLARETVPSMTLSVTPTLSDFSKPVSFVATLNTSTSINTGTITFLRGSEVIASVPIVNNTATFETNSLSTGSFTASAYYAGSITTPKYYAVYSNNVAMTVTSGVYIGAPLELQILSDSFQGTGVPYITGETITLRSFISTSTIINDFVRFRVNGNTVGYANFNGSNLAVTTTVFVSSGTYNVEALWDGAQIGATFYAGQSTSTNIQVLQGYDIVSPILLQVNSPDTKNRDFAITATITTSTPMLGTLTFYANGISLGTAQWNSSTNKAVITTATIANTGSYTLQALWSGGYLTNGRLYAPKYSNTASMTIIDGFEISRPISLLLETPQRINDNFIVTATITTSTLMANTVTFYANDVSLGTANFNSSTNKATLSTATIANTGTYIIKAIWSGGTLYDGRLYLSKESTTSSMSILGLNSTDVDIAVNPDEFYYYNINGTTNTFVTATIVLNNGHFPTHPPRGTVELYDGATFMSTLTMTTSTNTFTWRPIEKSQIDSGYRNINAQYLGDSYNTTSSSTASFIAKTKSPVYLTSPFSRTIQNPLFASTDTYSIVYPQGLNGQIITVSDAYSTFTTTATIVGTTATFTAKLSTSTNGGGALDYWNHSLTATLAEGPYWQSKSTTLNVAKQAAVPYLFVYTGSDGAFGSFTIDNLNRIPNEFRGAGAYEFWVQYKNVNGIVVKTESISLTDFTKYTFLDRTSAPLWTQATAYLNAYYAPVYARPAISILRIYYTKEVFNIQPDPGEYDFPPADS